MSGESAWDSECAAAGEVMGDDVGRHHDRNRELLAEVERLEAENGALRRLLGAAKADADDSWETT